jgi:hypothetical protein
VSLDASFTGNVIFGANGTLVINQGGTVSSYNTGGAGMYFAAANTTLHSAIGFAAFPMNYRRMRGSVQAVG